jgi:hypothetical protein
MKITLSIDSKESIEIGHAELASIVDWATEDDLRHATFFSHLRCHPVSEIRKAVAGMSFMDIETLELLARDKSIDVVRQVANNKRALKMLKTSLLQEMISRDVSIAAEIAQNLSKLLEDTRKDVIQVLLQHTDPSVVETAESFVVSEDISWEE